FEMLTGAPPYRGSSVIEVLEQHVHPSTPKLPSDFSALQPLIDKMLAPRPENRVANVGQVLRLLDCVRLN
ncbi:MAG: serine/threonine protein kinase, partial [Gammaproteobacteria bacterium]|nr:serine/threonine protein kinase [Gammaproteobacteria bacterium]